MPYILIVFRNGPVGGEEAGPADIDEGAFCPVERVPGVIGKGLVFADNIGVEIGQGLEPVFVDQFVLDRKSVV